MTRRTDRPRPGNGKVSSNASQVQSELVTNLLREVHQKDLNKQREKLDPETLPEIVRRIRELASRAIGLHPPDAVSPGLECIVQLAYDLRIVIDRDLPRRRGEVRERHAQALAKIQPASLPYLVHRAMEDAATLSEITEDEDGNVQVLRRIEAHDQEALGLLRERLRSRVRRGALKDPDLLKVLNVYRPGAVERDGGCGNGRPKLGREHTAINVRAEALAKLLSTIGERNMTTGALVRLLNREAQRAKQRAEVLAKELQGEARGRSARRGT